MSATCIRARSLRPVRERGVALVVVLILLLVVTLLALASLRNALLAERMSASVLDRSLAFQAVEAALREGEAYAATRPVPTTSGCVSGPMAGRTPRRFAAASDSSSICMCWTSICLP